MGVVVSCLARVKVEVVRVSGFMDSEKVASALVAVATPVAPSAGATATTIGAAASIVQVLLAGVGSVLPAASVAYTWKVCSPSAKLEYCVGEVHALKAAALSSLHAKEESASEEE